MSKNTVEFKGSDLAALNYIKSKGYASYSSLTMVKNCSEPQKTSTKYFDIGTEVHSQFLEKKKALWKTLTPDEREQVKSMVNALNSHPVVSKLMVGAKVEQKFDTEVFGLRTVGYIDILLIKDIADLKTTRHKNVYDFAADMNFLQAALYRAATGRNDFYYIGIQKQLPFKVFVFNIHQYATRVKEADLELKRLIKYVKKKTGL